MPITGTEVCTDEGKLTKYIFRYFRSARIMLVAGINRMQGETGARFSSATEVLPGRKTVRSFGLRYGHKKRRIIITVVRGNSRVKFYRRIPGNTGDELR